MKNLLQKVSTSLIFSGLMSLLFGILCFAWPDITLVALVWLFGISIIGQGIAFVSSAVTHRKEEDQWWVLLLIGLINIVAGLLAIFYPGISALFLVALMGITWLITGIIEVIAAIRLRKEIENEGWLILGGLLSVIAGAYILVSPGSGALAILWLIALYAIIFGILLILLGYKAKGWQRRIATRQTIR
ncbi:MAG TPA: HdeD family acid-resistance protein [Flavitalea sp.]|nr:HdeD family acid-resistance protein [Flavitalea sp.]